MINAAGFIDTSFFTATLINRFGKQLAPDEPFQLRALDHEGEPADLMCLKEWKSGKSLLTKLRNQLAGFNNGRPVKLAEVAVEQLDPGRYSEWTECDDAYSAGVFRLRICLVPSPGDWLYCNGAAANPAVGLILNYDHRKLHSCVNLGPCRRLHLVVDVLKPEVVNEMDVIAKTALAEAIAGD